MPHAGFGVFQVVSAMTSPVIESFLGTGRPMGREQVLHKSYFTICEGSSDTAPYGAAVIGIIRRFIRNAG